MSSRLSPPLAYRLGLVAQILTDATPSGLTLRTLLRRSRLAADRLDEALRVGVARGYLRCEGERHYAAPTLVNLGHRHGQASG